MDNCPRGYRVVSVYGCTASHRYQSSCESRVGRRGEFYNLHQPFYADKRAEFVLNCYECPTNRRRARLDDGHWLAMAPHAAPEPSHSRIDHAPPLSTAG